MPVTTEAVNDDVKELRKDFHEAQITTTKEFGEVKAELGKISTRLNMVVAILGGVSIVAITGLCTGFFWAGSIDNSVRELRTKVDASDAKLSDLQASIAKLLEQTKTLR
jgi:hypothetical protein